MKDEQIYTLALTRIPGLGQLGACNLVRTLGSASAIFRQRNELPSLVPGVTDKLVKALDCPEAIKRAEEELMFAEKPSKVMMLKKDGKWESVKYSIEGKLLKVHQKLEPMYPMVLKMK